MKFLLYIVVFFIAFPSCRKEETWGKARSKYLPVAIYQLATATFDTSKPATVQQFWYDSDDRLIQMRRRFYTNGFLDYYNEFLYDIEGNIIRQTIITDRGEKNHYYYTYKLGKPLLTVSTIINSSFTYNASGMLSEANDTLWSFRVNTNLVPEKWIYSYTNTGINIQRYSTIPSGVVEGNHVVIEINRLINNPFKNLSVRVDHLYEGTVYPIENYLLYIQSGMVGQVESVLPNGQIATEIRYEVLRKLPGTAFPVVIKVTRTNYYGSTSSSSSAFFHHILYKEVS